MDKKEPTTTAIERTPEDTLRFELDMARIELGKALAALEKIHGFCSQYTFNRLPVKKFLAWTAIECERVLWDEKIPFADLERERD